MILGLLHSFIRFLGHRVLFFSVLSVISCLIIFAGDLLIAVALQRVFLSVNLLNAHDTQNLFYPLQSTVFECLILLSIGFVRLTFVWSNNFSRDAIRTLIETEKRNNLISETIQSTDKTAGQIVSLYSDHIPGAAVFISNAFFACSRALIAFGLMIALVFFSWSLFFVLLCILLFLVPIQKLISRLTTKMVNAIQDSHNQSVTKLSNMIKSLLYLKIHRLENQAAYQIEQKIDHILIKSMEYYSLGALRTVIPQAFGLVTIVLLCIFGRDVFMSSPSTLLIFIFITIRFFQTLSEIGNVSNGIFMNVPKFIHTWTWWKDMDQQCVHSAKSDEPDTSDGPFGWIAEHMSFHHHSDSGTAIQNISFTIKPGDLILITGPSGSGKTTLIKLLLGLIQPTFGHLFYIDPLGKPSPLHGYIPTTVSYVSSDHFMTAGTIREQLLSGIETTVPDDTLWSYLSLAHADFVRFLPGGLDYILTEQGEGLSAGQKQRIALARALLRKPSVLVLDEATSNLDIESETEILKVIHTLHGKTTVLMITHRVPDNFKYDQHILLNRS
jgi:ABC-type bacteriocin/lantibiotic exporter with double-glycine peptidase domain